MAKTMAYIEDHQVRNLIWCDDNAPQTGAMINVGKIPAGIGDTWDGERFYRNGKLVLTDLEQLEQTHLEEIAALIEEIYQEDLEVFE